MKSTSNGQNENSLNYFQVVEGTILGILDLVKRISISIVIVLFARKKTVYEYLKRRSLGVSVIVYLLFVGLFTSVVLPIIYIIISADGVSSIIIRTEILNYSVPEILLKTIPFVLGILICSKGAIFFHRKDNVRSRLLSNWYAYLLGSVFVWVGILGVIINVIEDIGINFYFWDSLLQRLVGSKNNSNLEFLGLVAFIILIILIIISSMSMWRIFSSLCRGISHKKLLSLFLPLWFLGGAAICFLIILLEMTLYNKDINFLVAEVYDTKKPKITAVLENNTFYPVTIVPHTLTGFLEFEVYHLSFQYNNDGSSSTESHHYSATPSIGTIKQDKKDVEILLLQPNQRSVVTINLHWDENDDDLDKFFHGSIVTWHYYSYSDLDGWSNKSAVSDQTASRSYHWKR